MSCHVYDESKVSVTPSKYASYLRNLKTEKVSSLPPPPGMVKKNQIFIYEVFEDTADHYWLFDSYEWRVARTEKIPKGSKWCYIVTYQLLSRSGKEEFFRKEVMPTECQVEPPNNWGNRRPFVLVQYVEGKGKYNLEDYVLPPKPHRNSKLTPQKVTSLIVRNLLHLRTPQKSPDLNARPPNSAKRTPKRTRSPSPFIADAANCTQDLASDELSGASTVALPGRKKHKALNLEDKSAPSIPNSVEITTITEEAHVIPVGKSSQIKTHKSVLNDIREQLLKGKAPMKTKSDINRVADFVHGDNGRSRFVKNIKQVYNIKEDISAQLRHDDLYEVYNFAEQYPGIVERMQLVPSLVLTLFNPEMNQHFASVLREHKAKKPILLHYDTTFDVGKFFTSILSARHPLFKEEKIIPLCALFHQDTSGSSHRKLFKAVREQLGLQGQNVVIVTDREQSIINAIRDKLPNVRNIYCWNHIRRNVEDWVSKRISPLAADGYGNDVFRLLQSRSDEEYAEMKKNLSSEWDQKFLEYFKKEIETSLKSSYRPILEDLKIYITNSGITNNAAESVNKAFKESFEFKKNGWFQGLSSFYFYQNDKLTDIRRGMRNEGGFKPIQPFPDRIYSPKNIRDQMTPPLAKKVIEEGKLAPQMPRTYNSTQLYLDTTLLGLARWLHAEGRVTLTASSVWLVRGLNDIMRMVNLKDSTCSCKKQTICEHLLSVRIAAGIGLKSDNKRKRLPNLTSVYERTIKKSTGTKKGQGFRLGPNVAKEMTKQIGVVATSSFPFPLLEGPTLPELSNSNKDTVILRLPSGLVKFGEMKTTQVHFTPNDESFLSQMFPGGNINWLVDSLISGFLLKVTDCFGGNIVSVSTDTSQAIFSLEAYQPHQIFGQEDCVSEDYIVWANVEQILIPYNVGELHWVLFLVSVKQKEIHVLDPSANYQLCQEFKKRLQDIFNLKLGLKKNSSWKVRYPEFATMQASNAVDECGTFVCFYGEAISRGWSLNTMPEIGLYRSHICATLFGKCKLKLGDLSNATCSCPPNTIKIKSCDFCGRAGHLSCLQKAVIREKIYFICD